MGPVVSLRIISNGGAPNALSLSSSLFIALSGSIVRLIISYVRSNPAQPSPSVSASSSSSSPLPEGDDSVFVVVNPSCVHRRRPVQTCRRPRPFHCYPFFLFLFFIYGFFLLFFFFVIIFSLLHAFHCFSYGHEVFLPLLPPFLDGTHTHTYGI